MAGERRREHGIDAHPAAIDGGAGRAHIRMRRRSTGDVWVDAKLLQVEEWVTEARQLEARRARLRDARPPRRGVRVWLAAALLAASERLLGPSGTRESAAPDSAGGAVAARSQSVCPHCRRSRPEVGGHPVTS